VKPGGGEALGIYNLAVELQIHHIDGGHAIASFGPVLIRVITSARTDTAVLDEVARLSGLALTRWPMIGVWVVAHHGAPLPDGDARRHSGLVLRPFRDRSCVVFSLLGLGFWASAAIAVSKVLALLSGHHPLINTSVEDGAERLGLELIGVDAEKLAVIHDELLEAIQTHAKVA
jgi:hypothetical protein